MTTAATKKKWKSLSVSSTILPSIHELTNKPLEAGLWCLYVSKHEFNTDYLTYEEIGNVLQEYLDVPINVARVKKAFARAGKKVIKNGSGVGYKISNPGEAYLLGLKKNEPLNVMYINPNKPRTATKDLESMIKSIPKDDILICDPYYGMRTLEVLEMFAQHHKSVKLLTLKIGGGEKAVTLARAVADFKKENGKKVEIRVSTDKDLHDRYVIAKDRFFIIGHGIKDLGSKESLIVGIEDKYGKDIRKTVARTFLARWSAGTVL